MKKLLIIVFLIYVGIFALHVTTSSGKQLTLKLGDYYPVKSGGAIGIERFAELAEKKSDNELKIEVYHASQLGKILSQVEGVRMGTQDIAVLGVSMLQQFGDAFKMCNIAYAFRSYEHYQKWCKSPLFKETVEKPLASKDLMFINPEWNWIDGPYRVFISKEPVFSLGDLQGKKMRIYESKMAIRVWSHLGVTPITVAWGEAYLGLRQGLVSSITSPIGLLYGMKFTEVAKFVLRTDEYFVGMNMIMNPKKWGKLSKKQQDALVQAAIEVGPYFSNQFEEKAKQDIEKMKREHNAVFYEINLEPWRERMKELYPVLEEEGLLPKGYYDKVQKIK